MHSSLHSGIPLIHSSLSLSPCLPLPHPLIHSSSHPLSIPSSYTPCFHAFIPSFRHASHPLLPLSLSLTLSLSHPPSLTHSPSYSLSLSLSHTHHPASSPENCGARTKGNSRGVLSYSCLMPYLATHLLLLLCSTCTSGSNRATSLLSLLQHKGPLCWTCPAWVPCLIT